MSRKVLSLEIREESIAAVLLDSSFKGSQLETQGFFPIPAEKEGNEGIKAALQTLVETINPTGATCVLGIPATLVSFRNLSVPFHDIKKIRQILPFELEPSLPIPVEELIFDFEAVKHDKQQDLLTFSIKKAEIQRYLDLLETVSLRPVVIMPGGYAAARFISTMTDDSSDFIFIDNGEGNHTIYAVCSGHVRMVRTLPVAGDGNPIIRNLETTLKRTFTALQESQGIGVDPSAVFSAGPQAPLLTTGNGSSTLLGVPVRSIDGLRTFPRLKGSLDTPQWQSGHLDIALALALMESESVSGVNFSTERSTIQHYWSEYRNNIILTACLILLALVTALGGQLLAVNAKQQRLAELDRQIEMVFKSTFPEVTRVEAPLQQMQIKIKAAGDGSTGFDLTGARVRVIDILNALSQQIPSSADVKVNRMVVGADNVVLSGDTDTFNTVDDVKGRLEEADLFTGVTISSADLEKSGNRVRFKLKLDF
ncbi:MAG: PilN domain-containing protein [Desulfosarcina sp.]|nr:PilN domain-containing protein [Desulfosarcina sp.]